jgi:glycosyltransferase involved in cell wall biosynthesis
VSLPGVVMLTPNFHPHVGGAEKQALELSRALLAKGVPVRVLTRRRAGLPDEETVHGVPVRRVAAWGPGIVDSAVFMLSSAAYLLAHRGDYGTVHVHLAGSPALAACLAGALLGKRVVVKVGGGRGIGEIALSGKSLPGRVKLRLLRLFRPDLVVVTRELVDELREFGLQAVGVVPNGVDTKAYRPVSPAERDAFRACQGWPGGPCFLYVGRLAPEKRLERFIEAFARSAGGSDAFFVLVGAGPEEALLRRKAREAGITRRVMFCPPREDIARVYAAADVFVLPSVSEGLSNALLEAMSSGLAVLGSRVGGTADAVVDGVSGLLFDPGDPGGPDLCIRRLLDSPELVRRLGRAARETAEGRFSLERAAESYLRLYRGERPPEE